MYDCIKKTSTGDIELLKPNTMKRKINQTVYVIGEPIRVAHAVNIWTDFLRQSSPRLFGLSFSGISWNTFGIMDETRLREHYRYFADTEKTARRFAIFAENFVVLRIAV